jgi:hypothetical protein
MRISSFTTIGAVVLATAFAGSVAASAQSPSVVGQKRVFGYQDAKGVFHPLSRSEAPETTTAPFTGTFELTIAITLKTPVPSGYAVYCTTDLEADATNDDTSVSEDYSEIAYSEAKVSGSTASCTVNTPYSWVIVQASSTETDSITGTYSVEMVPTAANAVELGRSTSGTFVNLTKIPATGATSKYTINATL